MAKFARGSWVTRKGDSVRGMVRGHRGKSTLVCWVGHSKATVHGTRALRRSAPPRAVVLEGSLDDNLESLRSEEDLLRNWLDASNVTLGYKNIHTLEDIPILTKGLHDNPPPFIHLSCHGFHDSDGRAYILLAPRARKKDHIYLNDRKTQRVFRKNFRGVPILFSACLLGKYQDEMKEFREAAALGPVAGFTREISDSEAMLFELLLYQGVLMKGWNFSRAVEKACDAMALVGVLGSQGKAQRFVRVF